jgi:hypothetical protein
MGRIRISPEERKRRIEILWDCINEIGECRIPTKLEIDQYSKKIGENALYEKLLQIGGLKKLSQEMELPMTSIRQIQELGPKEKIHIETDVSPGIYEMFTRLKDFYGISKKSILVMLIANDYNKIFGCDRSSKEA